MDHQAFAQLLGNYGEFVGAIAVMATLFYLAIQVKHGKEATEANTQSIEESRKVAMVQTIQARAAESAAHYRMLAQSEFVPLILKFEESGLDALTEEERVRFVFLEVSSAVRQDATYYAHQLGLLDEDAYETGFIPSIQAMAPMWKALGVPPIRSSFAAEVDRILTLDPRPGSSGHRVERPSG
jgi:hypothetical protein